MKITAIAGRNGSGKTQSVEQLRKQLASDKVRYIAFADSYGPNVDNQYYLQLRWNQHDIDHETPTVGDLLETAFLMTGDDTPERREMQRQLYSMFHMDESLDKYIITLSSGELRKFQLTKTLFANPKLLIMDNPFIGLDAETRDQLRQLLLTVAKERDMELILVLAKTDDIPDYVTDVQWMSEDTSVPPHVLTDVQREAILSLPYTHSDYDCQRVVEMHHVTIRYGSRTILKDLDWTVNNGDRWALSGQNGSGKSTLLSLVCADNPQSYACDITLFDRPRGSGETIWDIKRHIGYVSPEMHRSYRHNIPAIEIIASGLKDTVGLYTRPSESERVQCRKWLNAFGISHLEERKFLEISSGEQRLVLLARAFVKEPDLLILDEPLHGLDNQNRHMVKSLVDRYCKDPMVTLIYVTHYQEELPQCIDHSIFLEKH